MLHKTAQLTFTQPEKTGHTELDKAIDDLLMELGGGNQARALDSFVVTHLRENHYLLTVIAI